MSIYGIPIYADGTFFGSDENNNPAGGPYSLNAYQNSLDTVILYWTLFPMVSTFQDFSWTVETDLVSTFDSANLRTYTTDDNPSIVITGGIHSGMAVQAYPRTQVTNLTMYWRVKGTYGGVDTVWVSSAYNEFSAVDGSTRDNMLNLMPNPIYKKDSTSNFYNLHWSMGQSIDDLWVQDSFVNSNNYIAFVQDIALQNNFAYTVGITRPLNMKAIDFREIIRTFFAESRNSPTTRSIYNMVVACLGFPPVFELIRDNYNLYVSDEDIYHPVDPFYVTDDNPSSFVDSVPVWDNLNLATGVIVHVQNPCGALITRAYLQGILRKMVFTHTPLYVVGIS